LYTGCLSGINYNKYNLGGDRMAKNKKSEDNCIKVLNEIDKIKRELETARINFDMVSDNELTDYYIYEMAALNSKYRYYIETVRNYGKRI
jgi:hypothetical protein